MTLLRSVRLVVGLALAATAAAAGAQTLPPPQGVLELASSAAIEVPRDLLQITFSTRRDGADANTVQAQLKQALDAALAEARKSARPGQLDVQTGAFSITPRYTNKGEVSGWQGTAELNVEGRDIAAISQLAGRITTLTVGRAGYALSRDAREKAEAEVAGQAIARFRAKASEYARSFGYAGYSVREVAVNGGDEPIVRPRVMNMQMAPSSSSGGELPVEVGKSTVTVTVHGSIQMK
jgi:predicted secreted protein